MKGGEKASTSITDDNKSSLTLACSGCLNSQIFPMTASRYSSKRSSSCPNHSNRKVCPPISTKTTDCYNSNITKRWHSIPSIYLDIKTHTAVRTRHHSSSSEWSDVAITRCSMRPTPLIKRIIYLFLLGVFLALLLNVLQKQKKVTVFSPGIFGDVLNSAWWIPPTFGLAAIVIGLVYPKLDELFGDSKPLHNEWPRVMRCIALFVGINHASARIDFESNVHLLLTLAMLSLGLWYFFDQSMTGLAVGVAVTSIATAATQVLVAMDVFAYANPDFLYMQSWIPCLYFSGGITIGTFGRALASFERVDHEHYD